MISRLELNSRIRLCRQLARREPANRALWMAEAGNWSRLSKERLQGEAGEKVKIGSGILASLRAWSARSLSDPASERVACTEASQKHEHCRPPR
jgi:hypothetical protein